MYFQKGGNKPVILVMILLCYFCCWCCCLTGFLGVVGGPKYFQKIKTSYRKITGQYKESKKKVRSEFSSSELKKLATCATIGGGVNDAKKGECCGNHANCQTKYCDRKKGAPAGLCIYDFPRKSGQPCSFHEDCSGYGSGPTQMACCDGTCKKKRKKGVFDLFGSCP